MMPMINDFPLEIVALILGRLDNIRFLLPALLACQHFSAAYREQSGLRQCILQRQIGKELLPDAIAVHLLRSLEAGEAAKATHEVMEMLYSAPARLKGRMKDMSLLEMTRIGRRHEVVRDLATDFANAAWSLMSREPLIFSDLEHLRFCRAFYRFDILCTLLHQSGNEQNAMDIPRGPKIELLARHPPWENEQIVSVHDFMEDRLMAGKSGDEILQFSCITSGDKLISLQLSGSHWPTTSILANSPMITFGAVILLR